MTVPPDSSHQSLQVLRVLHGDSVSVVVDVATPVPTIVHWGARLDDDVQGLRIALERPIPHGGLDVVAPLSVLPEAGSGYLDRPGLEGHRADGRGWAPRFTPVACEVVGRSLTATSVDEQEHLTLVTELVLRASDALRVRVTLRNDGVDAYTVSAVRPTLPLPPHAREVLTFAGRWTNEFQPVRQLLTAGSVVVENRSGRTSHNRVPVAFAGTAGFTESTGEVWGVHLEWSGNSCVSVDATTDGRRSVQAGELLLPGEVVLAPGASYTSPWVCAAHSLEGANGVSRHFHDELRSRPHHPSSPRPVTLNIWEAVYFDHDLPTLQALADVAADVGVERFVVDDGWFHGRRHDRAGLGDWWVDPAVWPDGLGPLVEHVKRLGMQFGLWVEPEMVNPDSDLFRTHPDWVLTDQRYEPVVGRSQLVLDLANEEVRAYLFAKLDALLAEYPIDYLKWDNNREYVHASHHGRAAVHTQTLGTYRLMDDLVAAHPHLEIESCASGGGRIDFAILERTTRVWTSDCNDPLDRQRIQRGFSYVFPPEYMGAHVGPPGSHTTRRRHSLGFRCGTAFFGHFGIEWNLLDASDADRKSLAAVIDAHKRHRTLLHGGRAVRIDHSDDSMLVHGVIAADHSEALVAVVQMTTAPSLHAEPVRIPGLDPARRYRVEIVPTGTPLRGAVRRQPTWLATGFELSGRQFAVVGFQPPTLDPESLVLLHLNAV